uniref:Sidoreflexin n=1 Tax=Kryptolebias marmoratus TaxID=37003 RepID=A0A3Q3ANV6_KRYMA
MSLSLFDIDAPRWDQSTFTGRLKHFFNITDCRTALLSDARLDEAKALVESCRAGSIPPGTTAEQLHYAKKLYDSAFHPDTGDRMNLIGRMSFQVPGGMAITGFMLQFYRTVPAVVFWQWVNQSFNALVNYTNRNAASPITPKQIGVAYVTATSTALATAVGLNLYTKRAPPLVARWVPFVAVAAANCVNIPMMRQQEILNGIAVTDENGNKLGHSKKAATKGITQVVVSRITMAAPGMIILPIIMQRLEKYKFMQLHVCFEAGARAERLHRVSVRRQSSTRLLQQRPLSPNGQRSVSRKTQTNKSTSRMMSFLIIDHKFISESRSVLVCFFFFFKHALGLFILIFSRLKDLSLSSETKHLVSGTLC